MIYNEQQFKEKLYEMIKESLKEIVHIFISEYYGAYTWNDDLVDTLLASRQFRLYVADYFHEYLEIAMCDCVTDESTKEFILDTINEYQLNSYYLDDLLDEMRKEDKNETSK